MRDEEQSRGVCENKERGHKSTKIERRVKKSGGVRDNSLACTTHAHEKLI